MSDGVVKIIEIAAAVVVIMLVIFFGFKAYNKAHKTGETAIGEMDSMTTMMMEEKYVDYEGSNLSGSQVQSALSQFKGDYIAVCVKTGTNASGYYLNYNTLDSISGEPDATMNEDVIKNMNNKSNPTYYVNPNAKFSGVIHRDAAGTITGIEFEQQ